MKILAAVVLVLALVSVPGTLYAKGCSAKVNCTCMCSGLTFDMGSRDVNGKCSSLFGSCVGSCCAKDNLSKGADLCMQSYGEKCKKKCEPRVERGKRFFYSLQGSDRCGETATTSREKGFGTFDGVYVN